MDGSTVEHSDSDSGESWTLLENTPTYGQEAPDFPESTTIPTSERINDEVHSEKDEDTDGISIISDSDHESTSCDINYVPSEIHLAQPQNIPVTISTPTNINHNKESSRDEMDFLGDKTKCKTYVHRRNPKVGSILDIIMLGTFVITAGMALGHLWSCKNECTSQTSVNKVLSNLYKLQEENTYLRNKLKEISLATGYQLVQRKSDKPLTKQQRCKKIFEEPIIKNNNGEPGVKCVLDDKSVLKSRYDPPETPEYEKEILNDINKMKKIYDQHKNWLDIETKKQEELIKSRFVEPVKSVQKNENLKVHSGPTQTMLNTLQPEPSVTSDSKTKSSKAVKSHRQINLERQLGPTYIIPPGVRNKEDEINLHRQSNLGEQVRPDQHPNPSKHDHNQNYTSEYIPEKKITYADSLKTENPLQTNQKTVSNDKPSIWTKDYAGKRKHKYDNDLSNLNSFSENDIIKDDRYTGPKIKHEKKRNDRQKLHKKQKRNNKYEQWQMKGGYLKDFDEFSIASSQDNDKNLLINPNRIFKDPDFANYVIKLLDTESIEKNASKNDQPKTDNKSAEEIKKVEKHNLKGDKPQKKGKTKDWQWYDQRSTLRAKARLKLEHELFGENTSNNAAWYFRRMQKREQCRAQKDNSTYKKIPKRKMNFKMKR